MGSILFFFVFYSGCFLICAQRRGYFGGVDDVGAGNGIIIFRFHLSAEQPDGTPGFSQLPGVIAAFHRKKDTARFHIGQAKLAKKTKPGHGAGDSRVKGFTAAVGYFLGAGMETRNVRKTESGAGVTQKTDALVKTVEQHERKRGTGNLQSKARKTGAGAHVDHALSCERNKT